LLGIAWDVKRVQREPRVGAEACSRPANEKQSSAHADRDLRKTIQTAVTRRLRAEIDPNIEPIDYDASFTESGLDSVGIAVLALEVEKLTAVRLSSDVLYEYTTINRLARFVETRHSVQQNAQTRSSLEDRNGPGLEILGLAGNGELSTEMPPTLGSIRFASACFDAVRVIRATTPEHWAAVSRLRASGFSRIPGFNQHPEKWTDNLDESPQAFSLLACGRSGQWSATMRVQDGRLGALEIAKFINIQAILKTHQHPAVQMARLSVLHGPEAMDLMFGIIKAAWGWCIRNEMASIICAAPSWTRDIYDFMLFSSLGPAGEFFHDFPTPTPHATMLLSPLVGAELLWRTNNHPLCGQFFDTYHPGLFIE
jgi:acyl carrier protein